MKQKQTRLLLSTALILCLVFSQTFVISPVISKAKAARSYLSFEKNKYEVSITKTGKKDVLSVKTKKGITATISFALDVWVSDNHFKQTDYNTIASTESNDNPYLKSEADKYKLYFPETDDKNNPVINLDDITGDNIVDLKWSNPGNSTTTTSMIKGESREIENRSATNGEIIFNINGVVVEGEFVFAPTNSNACTQFANGLYQIGFATEAGEGYIRITSGNEATDVKTISRDEVNDAWVVKPPKRTLEGYYIEFIPDKSEVLAKNVYMIIGNSSKLKFEVTEQFPNGAISLADFPSAMYKLTMKAVPIKQSIKVSSPKNAKATVKASRLKKKDQKVTIKASAKTKIKYSVSSTPKGAKKSISLSKKSGKSTVVTLKKGAKKGKYKIKLTAASGKGYAKASKVVTITVK